MHMVHIDHHWRFCFLKRTDPRFWQLGQADAFFIPSSPLLSYI